MTSFPIESPIPYSNLTAMPWWKHIPIISGICGFSKYASIIYNSIVEQLKTRSSPPQPWNVDPIKKRIAEILTQTLNEDQFFGDYIYHPKDKICLLEVHPFDDMSIAKATQSLELEYKIKIPQSIFNENLTFFAFINTVYDIINKS